jgi:glycosyltransferase involved in cell wall biosynthesis
VEGKEVQLILAGYNRQYVINRLRKTCSNLEVLYFERIPSQYLNRLYNCLDLYIVSSRIEGGPQALVEASLARCPIVSTDVGLAKTILPPESIYNDANDFHLATPNVEVAYRNALKLAPHPGLFEKYKKMFAAT